jgi:3-hydroxy acid dehydrogenase/malonic semialdehyde reductase
MKVAITGTTKGIGKATKEKLLNLGHEVLCINRDQWDLNNIEEVSKIDLTRVDVLINNAGHDIGMGLSFNKVQKTDIISQINVNLLSPMLLTHSFVNQNDKGTVINITSGSIHDLKKNMTTYYTTKSGLSKFTQAITKDLKDNFRFVEVIPRRVRTSFFETSKAKHLQSTDFLIDAAEVAKVIITIIDNPYLSNITVKDHRR